MKRRKQGDRPPLGVIRPLHRSTKPVAVDPPRLTVLTGTNRPDKPVVRRQSRPWVRIWSWVILVVLVLGTLVSTVPLFF